MSQVLSQLGIVWRKEMRESWTNRKWIWLPLVFILLGVMEPISTYFMPQILKLSGGLPPGTVIHIPTPSAASVFVKAQSQYSTLGLLVLVLGFMGSVSNERQNGVLELVLVKPVSHGSYFLAKWLAASSVTLVALFLGDLASWYYTSQLIGPLSLMYAMISASVYGLWLLLVVTLTLTLSTLLNSPTANAFISLVMTAILSVFAGVFRWGWSPGSIPVHASDLVMQKNPLPGAVTNLNPGHSGFGWSLVLTVVLISGLLGLAVAWFKRRTFA